LGFGIGWSPDEYEAAGAPWKDRGRRAGESLSALKAIWTTDLVEIQGAGFKIPNAQKNGRAQDDCELGRRLNEG
jgi:alkanesulfonate monooxygenase SsuD/methylene tetrahydromethanopterin reductase-like flavin-dependent oxidoreductase (luciferase family)